MLVIRPRLAGPEVCLPEQAHQGDHEHHQCACGQRVLGDRRENSRQILNRCGDPSELRHYRSFQDQPVGPYCPSCYGLYRWRPKGTSVLTLTRPPDLSRRADLSTGRAGERSEVEAAAELRRSTPGKQGSMGCRGPRRCARPVGVAAGRFDNPPSGLVSVPAQVRSTDHMITLQIGKLVPVRLCAEYAGMRHEHAC